MTTRIWYANHPGINENIERLIIPVNPSVDILVPDVDKVVQALWLFPTFPRDIKWFNATSKLSCQDIYEYLPMNTNGKTYQIMIMTNRLLGESRLRTL